MLKKALVALGIFTILFISAWWVNEINEKRYYIDEQNEQIQLLMVDEEERFERFKPREYIKIRR
ncbi:hypothetical protein BKP45_05320 [Anaerobacillus alkalidiazotrophicus]|uniref:Uncharacterized protein n=2 Tax=Anaerobacillus TaxID=704093 RepID=A0A1S2MBX3_9BACI|nr:MULTISPECIES: hypothetical protein [Anaerobacillus]OIJ16660.1 hypothetical protein BKP37_05355 [Anaerobacillus alkalilacustris]OIJ22096.1 hypothetical protein BKP45_05320 [Anaerobacillus alkalidiazotrophicus]